MPNIFVLLTALPPTTGHLELVQFASQLARGVDGATTVLLNTQPCEPFPQSRAIALKAAIEREGLHSVEMLHMHETIEQDPSTFGFWEMWCAIMRSAGMESGDFIVASEHYGKRLAKEMGGKFFPYDMDRVINPAKATPIRERPFDRFDEILPEFQQRLRTTVTVFGAESCGKTTLSKQLAEHGNGRWLFEYARPFLENTLTEINIDSMTAIWQGQRALQDHGFSLPGKPLLVQDTDLFSTVGYWNLNQHGLGHLPIWSGLGAAPDGLVEDAVATASDLYIVTPSNIPFEEDPLRYSGDTREGNDAYWIDLLDEYDLPYRVLESSDRFGRLAEAWVLVAGVMQEKADSLSYDRKGL